MGRSQDGAAGAAAAMALPVPPRPGRPGELQCCTAGGRHGASPARAAACPASRRGATSGGQDKAAGPAGRGCGGAAAPGLAPTRPGKGQWPIGYISALPRRQAGGGRGGRPAGRLAG